MKHNYKTPYSDKVTQPNLKTIIEEGQLRKVTMMLRAVNHKLRQRIIDLLVERSLSDTEIAREVRIHEDVANKHLQILKRARVLDSELRGTSIYYSLNRSTMIKIRYFIDELLNY